MAPLPACEYYVDKGKRFIRTTDAALCVLGRTAAGTTWAQCLHKDRPIELADNVDRLLLSPLTSHGLEYFSSSEADREFNVLHFTCPMQNTWASLDLRAFTPALTLVPYHDGWTRKNTKCRYAGVVFTAQTVTDEMLAMKAAMHAQTPYAARVEPSETFTNPDFAGWLVLVADYEERWTCASFIWEIILRPEGFKGWPFVPMRRPGGQFSSICGWTLPFTITSNQRKHLDRLCAIPGNKPQQQAAAAAERLCAISDNNPPRQQAAAATNSGNEATTAAVL